MQYQQHIEVLKCDVLSSFRKDPWEESIKSSSVFDLISSVVAINEPDRLADYARDLDLAFRTAFEAMIIAEETNNVMDENRDTVRFLKFALELGLAFAVSFANIARIPFVLIEDLLEMETIEKASLTWDVIESLVDKITVPELFTKGKFLVLKTCNSLLRRLSKSCNTEFCGRVLMFLAAIYPITERSAVNLPGKINVFNRTYFEDEEAFNLTVSQPNDGEEMKMDEAVDDLTVSKPSNSNMNFKGEAKGLNTVTYEDYKVIWGLQTLLASEQKVVDGVRPALTPYWRDFVVHCNKVFELFQRNGFSDAEIAESRKTFLQSIAAPSIRPSTRPTSVGDTSNDVDAMQVDAPSVGAKKADSDAYMSCKFLTSSELFTLQLRDAVLRQQIGCQILFVMHYVKYKLLPTLSDSVDVVQQLTQDLQQLHHGACGIIENTPPNGAELSSILQRLLSREQHWLRWKTDSCPPFERAKFQAVADVSAQPASGGIEVGMDTSRKSESNKMLQLNQRLTSVLGQKESSLANYRLETRLSQCKTKTANKSSSKKSRYEFDVRDAHYKAVAKNLVSNIPGFMQHLQPYIDAEDPDAGIDDEYHPKHDDVYCWRARRLIAANQLRLFDCMPDGRIAKGLAKMEKPEVNLTRAPRDVLDHVLERNKVAIVADKPKLKPVEYDDDDFFKVEEETDDAGKKSQNVDDGDKKVVTKAVAEESLSTKDTDIAEPTGKKRKRADTGKKSSSKSKNSKSDAELGEITDE